MREGVRKRGDWEKRVGPSASGGEFGRVRAGLGGFDMSKSNPIEKNSNGFNLI